MQSLAVVPRAAHMRRTMVVGNDRHGETQGVTGGVRHRPRRPSTAISPLVWGPAGSPLGPSIVENHGVDERSIGGVSLALVLAQN